MAVPVIESYSEDVSTSDNAVLSKPAGTVSGDLLIAVIAQDTDTAPTAPDGSWTEIVNVWTTSSVCRLHVWWKVAGGSEPSSYTFTGNDPTLGLMLRISGADTTSPINAVASAGSNTSSTSHVAPSIAPDVSDCLLLSVAQGDRSYISFTFPAGQTEVWEASHDNGSNSSSFQSAAVGSETLSASGATGTRTFTASASTAWRAASIAIAPASGGGGSTESGDGSASISTSASAGGASTATAVGSASITVAASGLTGSSAVASGDGEATASVSGAAVGIALTAGVGSASIAAAASGSAAATAAGAGSASASFGSSGAATSTAAGEGSASITVAAAGQVSVTASGIGTATVIASGAGVSIEFAPFTPSPERTLRALPQNRTLRPANESRVMRVPAQNRTLRA